MERTGSQGDSHEERMVIQIGFDVLNILTERFEREMGKNYERVWMESLEGMEGLSKALFEGIRPDVEQRDINMHIVRTRWEEQGDPSGSATPLVRAFLEVIGTQLDAVRRVLGGHIVDQAKREACRVLSMVDKYQGGTSALRAFMGLLGETGASGDR